ncbi:MAG TPA: lipopolysaccharide kinase InaA family protein [Candidatus Polarisedimenticolaceae bacterium]|nr:lipopolysaccharide kinase InaA family protein [Candidatus Polarisedimenticolaceae bacterium]
MDRRTEGGRAAERAVRSWPAPPSGFSLRAAGRTALYVDAALEADPAALRLGSWDGWRAASQAVSGGSGRGGTAVIEGAGGARWRIKLMRRGGRLASLWKDRYPSASRLVAILAASVEARARGIPTPRPIALAVEAGPSGLVRGAMAFEEVEGGEDLARRVIGRALTRDDLAAVMRAVRRMHDGGMLHPDLNLGNLLLRGARPDASDVLVIDLDRARFVSGPVAFGPRQAAIRRMERSCAKLTGVAGPLGPGTEDLWYSLYAGGDEALARRLARHRTAGRLSLALHRAGWRRS